MKHYRYLPHTSDVQFQAYGDSLEEAFTQAAYALTDVITDHTKIASQVTKTMMVQAEDEKALLYDFLEHFLVMLDSDDFLLHSIEKLTISKSVLHAEISGDTHPDHYDIHTHVKAVTYQNMRVERQNGTVMVQVVLDI